VSFVFSCAFEDLKTYAVLALRIVADFLCVHILSLDMFVVHNRLANGRLPSAAVRGLIRSESALVVLEWSNKWARA
jgi:hypothetical protein